MNTIILNNGVEMPQLGFGVYKMGDEDCERSVLAAFDAGYRLIDTAAGYMNERAVGRAIKRSGIPREQLFIATKLWIQSDGYAGTMEAFQKSMEKLSLDYLDLYLIHQPYGDYYGEWRAMTELHKEGKIRAIGVCNFSPAQLVDLICNSEVVPAVNQIEVHPFFQNSGYQKLMKEKGVQMQAWGPLAEGKNDIFNNAVLKSIGSKYGKTVAQVVLRWQMQCGAVAIPKSVHPDRMAENIDIFDFELDMDDMRKIAELDLNQSVVGDFSEPKVVEMLNRMKITD